MAIMVLKLECQSFSHLASDVRKQTKINLSSYDHGSAQLPLSMGTFSYLESDCKKQTKKLADEFGSQWMLGVLSRHLLNFINFIEAFCLFKLKHKFINYCILVFVLSILSLNRRLIMRILSVLTFVREKMDSGIKVSPGISEVIHGRTASETWVDSLPIHFFLSFCALFPRI